MLSLRGVPHPRPICEQEQVLCRQDEIVRVGAPALASMLKVGGGRVARRRLVVLKREPDWVADPPELLGRPSVRTNVSALRGEGRVRDGEDANLAFVGVVLKLASLEAEPQLRAPLGVAHILGAPISRTVLAHQPV